MRGDGQAANGTCRPKTSINNMFAILLDAKLKCALTVNAVQGLGCVPHVFLIMLLTALRTIEVVIEFNFFLGGFFGTWHYMRKSIF
jgi:hypothetical protein